jgi:GAF domain-containing protein
MASMTDAGGYRVLRAAALDAIVSELRETVAVDRCTLRLEVAGEFFPVVHESRTTRAGTLVGDREIPLQGQPVVEALLSGVEQVVQADSAAASADPAFQRMLRHYGGLGAQIVTPVREGERLLGIISLHHLEGTRAWSEPELALARAGAELVARLIGDGSALRRAAGGSGTSAPEQPG